MKSLIHWIIPTPENNHRARLISTPALSLVMLTLMLVNSVLGFVPVKSVFAEVTSVDLTTLHNVERAKRDLLPLEYNSVLSNSAQKKAQAMLTSDCWSHYCPEGKSPWDFFSEAGYDYVFAGENLAEGFFDSEEVMVAWMNSKTHRENILRPEYTEVGFGMARGDFQGIQNSVVIAVHFGTPSSAEVLLADNSIPRTLGTPVITNPRNGESSNADELLISGRAEEAEQVEVYSGGNRWVVADAEQGIFTYRAPKLLEGKYSISARGVAGLELSEFSDPVNFQIDRTSNQITAEDVTILNNSQNQILLQISEPDLKSLSVTIGTQVLGLDQKSEMLWEIPLTLTQLERFSELQITTIDLAGNSWNGSTNTGSILGKYNQSNEDFQLIENTILKSQINSFALIALLLLFGLDFVVLLKTGETKHPHTKTHMHFILLIIVGVVIITGSLGSQIGEGLSL